VQNKSLLVSEGFGKFQWLMLLYTGLAWCADAMEMMLLSFLGPAVSSTYHFVLIINIWRTLSVLCLMAMGVLDACPQSLVSRQQQW